MTVRWMVGALAALALLGSPAIARDLEDILEDKGVLSEEEAREARDERSAAARFLERVHPFGDLRVRVEGFRIPARDDRHRERVRLRFGAAIDVTSETTVGFQLASGNPDDPISTNQSFDDVFDGKDISLDTAWLKVTPVSSFGLSRPLVTLYAGKFELPTFRAAETVFDADVRPEGFHQILHVVESTDGLLRHLDLHAAEWSAEEVAAGDDSFVFAGQIAGNLRLSPAVGLELGVADYAFLEPDLVARERNENAALIVTNDVRLSDGTVAGGRLVDPRTAGPNGDGVDAEGDPIRIVGFNEDFNVLNVGGRLNLDTEQESWPVALIGDFAWNTEADREDKAFEVGVEIGRAREPGELSARYTYARKETNAVMSVLTFSDLGPFGGTNVQGHTISFAIGLLERLTGVARAYFTDPVDEPAGFHPDTSYRYQFDVQTSF